MKRHYKKNMRKKKIRNTRELGEQDPPFSQFGSLNLFAWFQLQWLTS